MKQSVLILLLVFSVSAFSDTPKIDKRISGVYIQIFKNESFGYLVDPRTRLCFITGAIQRISVDGRSITRIPCKNLKLRKEWQGIIRW